MLTHAFLHHLIIFFFLSFFFSFQASNDVAFSKDESHVLTERLDDLNEVKHLYLNIIRVLNSEVINIWN